MLSSSQISLRVLIEYNNTFYNIKTVLLIYKYNIYIHIDNALDAAAHEKIPSDVVLLIRCHWG